MNHRYIPKFLFILTCLFITIQFSSMTPVNIGISNASIESKNVRDAQPTFQATIEPAVSLSRSKDIIHQVHKEELSSNSDVYSAVNRSINNTEILQSKKHQFVKEMSNIFDPVFDGLETALENILDKDLSMLTKNMSSKDVNLSWYEVYKDVLDILIKRILPFLLYGYNDVEISSECQDALFRFVVDLKKGQMWTLKMLDAAGKPGGGILSGNTYFLGSFDQCMEVSVDMYKGKTLDGQYCLINLELPTLERQVSDPIHLIRKIWKNQDKYLGDRGTMIDDLIHDEDALVLLQSSKEKIFVLGICTPSLCTINDINAVLKSVKEKLNIKASAFRCETSRDRQWSTLHSALSVVFGGLLTLVLIGTTVDCFMHFFSYSSKDTKQSSVSLIVTLCRYYSLPRNIRKLLPSATKRKFLLLDGLKAMTMAWIILGHTYMFAGVETRNEKIRNLFDFFKNLLFHGLLGGSMYTVDTYFVISAMLLSHGFLSKWQKRPGNFPAFTTVVKRYFRIMPSVYAIIGLLFFMDLVVQGPLAKDYLYRYLGDIESCTSKWWSHMLAFSNFYESENICLGFFWYVCVDLQLLAMFLMPMYILLRCPSKGIVLHFLICLSFIGINYYIYQKADVYSIYPPYSYEKALYLYIHAHSRPNVHIPVYAIGILLGYLVYYHKGVKISKILQVALWCMTCAIMLTLTWITRKWLAVIRPSKADFFGMLLLGRIAWASCISWIIYASLSGRGSIVNSVLSWGVFVPFGRLNFASYLLNMFVIVGRLGHARDVLPLSHFNLICEFIVNFVFTYTAALVFYLIVESPFENLLSHRFMRCTTKSSDKRDMPETKNMSKEMLSSGINEIPKVDDRSKTTNI